MRLEKAGVRLFLRWLLLSVASLWLLPYLNVVEWGPGIYGADAACHAYDGTAARNTDRQQAARLAAILPAPLKRRPARMNRYSALILERMRQMGW